MRALRQRGLESDQRRHRARRRILAGPEIGLHSLSLALARHPAEMPRQHRALLLVRDLVFRPQRIRPQAPAKRRAVLVPQVVEPSVRQIAPRAEHVVVEHQLYFSRKIAVRRVQALEDRALGGSNRHALILTRWWLNEQVRSSRRARPAPTRLACLLA